MSRHRWAELANYPEIVDRLWAARAHLKNAWEADQEDPEHYPIITSCAFAEIKQVVAKEVFKQAVIQRLVDQAVENRSIEPADREKFVEKSSTQKLIERAVTKKFPNTNKKVNFQKWMNPRSLAELIPEKSVEAIWQDYNSGTFKDAIERAVEINYNNIFQSWKIFQTIIRAIEAVYLDKYLGPEFLSKPKVNILHTGLDEIAKAAALKDQTAGGFAEFLDDLCPCGLRSHKEAVRKLLKRSTRIRRSTI